MVLWGTADPERGLQMTPILLSLHSTKGLVGLAAPEGLWRQGWGEASGVMSTELKSLCS